MAETITSQELWRGILFGLGCFLVLRYGLTALLAAGGKHQSK